MTDQFRPAVRCPDCSSTDVHEAGCPRLRRHTRWAGMIAAAAVILVLAYLTASRGILGALNAIREDSGLWIGAAVGCALAGLWTRHQRRRDD